MTGHLDYDAAGVTLTAVLTATSLLWGLQTYLVWRAVEHPRPHRPLALSLLLQTIIAFGTVVTALVALLLLTIRNLGWWFDRTFQVAWWGAVAFAAIVVFYYVLILLDFLHRQDPNAKR